MALPGQGSVNPCFSKPIFRQPIFWQPSGGSSPHAGEAFTSLTSPPWNQFFKKRVDDADGVVALSGVGPRQRPDLSLEAFHRRIEKGQPVTIKGDGSQRRDHTHVADVAWRSNWRCGGPVPARPS